MQSFASTSNPISTVTTADNYVHIIYPNDEGIVYRKNTGSSWSSETSIASDGWYSPLISSSSNDLFVIYYDYWNDQLRYRQYDAAPLAPQNVAVTSNGNNNPVITWTANKEADLSVYRVYKKLTTESGTQTTYITTSSTSYTDSDFEITSPRLATDQVEYWVVAVDFNSHLSPESSHIIKTGESLIQWKKSLEVPTLEHPTDYNLSQNYPNPFNPTTMISYSIPEAGFVQLKVYNSLGEEIATLVNEYKEAGNYNSQFSISNLPSSRQGSQLPSGIYFYKLQVGQFNETKKMILMK